MGKRPENYNTRQGEAILDYLASHKNGYVTAVQIEEYFKSNGSTVSRATIYRRLERLVKEGTVYKYTFNGATGACYQYKDKPEEKPGCCHLKCEVCGGILNLKCGEVDHISRHILENHAFQVNDSKTVFYGKCDICLQKG